MISLLKDRGWKAVIGENLIGRMLWFWSLFNGVLVAAIALLLKTLWSSLHFEKVGEWLKLIGAGRQDDSATEMVLDEVGGVVYLGIAMGFEISMIFMTVISGAVTAVIVLFADDPQGLLHKDSSLYDEMTTTYSQSGLKFGDIEEDRIVVANIVESR